MEIIHCILVEDDLNWRKIFKILVEDHTKDIFHFSYAITLAESLQLIKDGNFDLIVLDLMLPDSQAASTIETMTNEVKDTPIIIITTLDDEKLIATAFARGIEDYLIKDQYSDASFVRIARQAVKRQITKNSNHLRDDLEKIMSNLQSIDSRLETFERNMPKISQIVQGINL